MCHTCWVADGAHRIDTPKVRELAAALDAADDCGPMHVVVGDDNLETASIEWCRKNVPLPWPPDDERCYLLLMAATFEERVSANGLRMGCWGNPEDTEDV